MATSLWGCKPNPSGKHRGYCGVKVVQRPCCFTMCYPDGSSRITRADFLDGLRVKCTIIPLFRLFAFFVPHDRSDCIA